MKRKSSKILRLDNPTVAGDSVMATGLVRTGELPLVELPIEVDGAATIIVIVRPHGASTVYPVEIYSESIAAPVTYQGALSNDSDTQTS